MKRSIEWHEECLISMKSYLSREIKFLNEQKMKVLKLTSDCRFLEFQINRAMRMGKDGFDPEQFGIKEKRDILPEL